LCSSKYQRWNKKVVELKASHMPQKQRISIEQRRRQKSVNHEFTMIFLDSGLSLVNSN
jgi:hypothetical protein